MPDAKIALIIGAGDATGGAIARRFAREGFTACVTRRNADKLAPLVASIESESAGVVKTTMPDGNASLNASAEIEFAPLLFSTWIVIVEAVLTVTVAGANDLVMVGFAVT